MASNGDVNGLANLQPDDVTDAEWKEFLEQRLSPTFLVSSSNFLFFIF